MTEAGTPSSKESVRLKGVGGSAVRHRPFATGAAVVSPWIYPILTLACAAAAAIETPFGWGVPYGAYDDLTTVATYVLAVGIGIWLSARIRRRHVEGDPTSVDPGWLGVVFAVATLVYVAKFVNIGDLPLLGDPMSRYRLTIGGFADFVSRLVTPLALLYVYRFAQGERSLKMLLPPALACLLHALMMHRQELLYVFAGSLAITLYARRMRITSIVTVTLATIVSLYVIIGLGAVLRAGSAILTNAVSIYALPFWVIHAELTIPFRLGAFVVSKEPDLLGGLYSVGEYLTLTGADYTVGANYINQQYVGAQTAQSIASPYSFLLDFGWGGMIACGLVTGIVLGAAYSRWRNPSSGALERAVYPLLLLSALWSIRSGAFLIGPLMAFSLLAILVSTSEGSRSVVALRAVARPVFLGLAVVALASLTVRL